MALTNCPNCHKVFPGEKGTLCAACSKQENEAFEKVKSHLVDNPDSNAEKAAAALGLDITQILRLLRAGRLEVKRPKDEQVCLTCGTPIESGLYCPRCLAGKKVSHSSGKGAPTGSKEEKVNALQPVRKTKKGQIHSQRIRRKSRK